MRAVLFTLALGKHINKARPLTPSEAGKIPTLGNNSMLGAYQPHRRTPVCSEDGSTCDWRTHNILGEAPDQGDIGDCWIWSAMGALRANVALEMGLTSPIPELSVQELVSCNIHAEDGSVVAPDGACSCDVCTKYAPEMDGGHPVFAMEYIKKFGATAASDYPVVGTDKKFCASVEKECKVEQQNHIVSLDRIYKIADGAWAHERAVLHHGPIAVLIKSDDLPYEMGKDTMFGLDVKCTGVVNHAVVMVGYGEQCKTENGESVCTRYWLIRNSWGPDWGDEGYFKVSQEADCGLTSSDSSVIALGGSCPTCSSIVV